MFAVRLLSLCALLPAVSGFGEAQKYLIVSSPTTHKVSYMKLPENGAPVIGGPEPMRALVSTGLLVPQGIAVDQYRKKLYVADPDLNKLVAYDLSQSGDALTVGEQQVIVDNIEARWVAVDGVGNVWVTDEGRNSLYKVPAANIESKQLPAVPIKVYSGATSSQMSSPGGVLSDNYFVYWVNKASGTQVGSLIRGTTEPNITFGGAVQPEVPLANNVMKSYGLCMGYNKIFYTDETANMFVVPRIGGTPQQVTNALSEPRGCAFDGDGTVYVADKNYNAVYQFASNAQEFSPSTPLTKAADFQGAFGVSVYVAT